jgi:hypothetical protein
MRTVSAKERVPKTARLSQSFRAEKGGNVFRTLKG